MKEPKSIEKFKDYPKSMDFSALKKEGVELTQRLSGDLWTDYNEHDPGITILENLCYALTELGYKCNFDIEDLFFSSKTNLSNGQKNHDTLFPVEAILPSSAQTLIGYRKLIIDRISGVKNAWVVPLKSSSLGISIQGLFRVVIQLEDGADKGQVIEETTLLVNSFRNLGEDFDEITIIEPREIQIGAIISIDSDAVGESVLADIYYTLTEELSPHHSLFNLEEMLELGVDLNKIYTGPNAVNGFIRDESLESSTLESMNRIYRSKLIKLISEVDGVSAINNFSIYIDGEAHNEEYIEIEESTFSVLNVADNIERDMIQLVSDGLVYNLNKEVLNYSYEILQAKSKKKHKRVIEPLKTKIAPKRVKEDIEYYFSLQNTFPRVYGITEFGIQGKESTPTKARTKQLKGYLVLFEQIIANFLSQLVNVNKLFSLDPLEQSYFGQSLVNVPEIEQIIGEFSSFEEKHQELIDKYDHASERRSRFLDHLLARLGEEFLSETANSIQRESNYYTSENFLQRSIESKIALLKDYINISRNRGKSHNYLASPYDDNNIPAAKKKIYHLFNMSDHGFKKLSDLTSDKNVNSKEVKKSSSINGNSLRFQGNNEDLLAEVMAYGMDRNLYAIVTDSKNKTYEIKYSSPISKTDYSVFVGSSIAECETALEKGIGKLAELNRSCEGFHILEHVLLRPIVLNLRFSVFYDKGLLMTSNVLASEEIHSMQGEFIEKIEAVGDVKKSYSVSSRDGNFMVTLKGADGKVLAFNDSFLQKEEANDHIKVCVDFFKSNKKNNLDLVNAVSIEQVTKKGMDFDQDHFSHQLSIFTPAYAGTFQSEKSKRLFESLVRINFPAHLKINFFWLDLKDMTTFEAVYEKWLTSKAGLESNDKLDDLSYVLLKMILNLSNDDNLKDKEIETILKASL